MTNTLSLECRKCTELYGSIMLRGSFAQSFVFVSRHPLKCLVCMRPRTDRQRFVTKPKRTSSNNDSLFAVRNQKPKTGQNDATMASGEGRSLSPPVGTTLSRNALYAPLVAYEQQNVDPSAYMTLRKSGIPVSLRESSLIEFLQSVTANNGSKSLSLQEVEERIKQRALTLVGGGINSSLSKQKPRQERRTSLSNRKRKRILQSRASTSSGAPKENDTFQRLLTINEKWNDYVRKLVHDVDSCPLDSMERRLSSRLFNMELAGAFVRITECSAHKAWVGKEGIVLGTTANTWRLVVVAAGNHQRLRKVLVVPKRGSQLSFKVALKPNEEGKPQVVCIVIQGNAHYKTRDRQP